MSDQEIQQLAEDLIVFRNEVLKSQPSSLDDDRLQAVFDIHPMLDDLESISRRHR
jgi:hypothetical protein